MDRSRTDNSATVPTNGASVPPNGLDPSDGTDVLAPSHPSFRAYSSKDRDVTSPRRERNLDMAAAYQESAMWRTPATSSRTLPSTDSPGGLPSWDQAESSSVASTHSSDTPSWAPRSPPRVRTKAVGQKSSTQDKRSNNGSPIPSEHLSPRSAKVVPPMPLDAIARVRQAKPNKQRTPNPARRPTSRARSVSPAAPDEPDMVPPVPPIAPQAQALANAAVSTRVAQPSNSKHGRAYGSAGSTSMPTEGHSVARHAHPSHRQPRIRRATSTITIVASRPSEEYIQEAARRPESRSEDQNSSQPSSKSISEQAKKRSSGENWTATFDALDSYQPEVPMLNAIESPKRRSRRGTQQNFASAPPTSNKAIAARAPPGHLDVSEEEASSAPSHVSPSLTTPESRNEQKQTPAPLDAQANPSSTPTKKDNGSESSCSSLESQLSRPIQSPPRRKTHIRVLSRSIERAISPDQDSPYRSPTSSSALSPRSAMRRQALYMHPDSVITPVQSFQSPTRSMISLASLQRTPRGTNIIPVDYGMSSSKSAPNVLAPAKGVSERSASTSSVLTQTPQDLARRKVSPGANIFAADTDDGPESWFAETSLPGEWDLHTPSVTREAPLLEDDGIHTDRELDTARNQSKEELSGDTSTIEAKADAVPTDVQADNADELVDADVSVNQIPPSSEKETTGGMGIGAFAAAAAAAAVANATKTAEAVQNAVMPQSSPQDQTDAVSESAKDVNNGTSQPSSVVHAKDTTTSPSRLVSTDSSSESIATVPSAEQTSLGNDISISDASANGQIANEPEVAASTSAPQGTFELPERVSEPATTQLDQPSAAPTDASTQQATEKVTEQASEESTEKVSEKAAEQATEQASVSGIETSREQNAKPISPSVNTDTSADAAQPTAQADTMNSQEDSAHDVNVAAPVGGLASGAVLGASAGPVGVAGGAVIGAALGTAAVMLTHSKHSEQHQDPTAESSEATAEVVTPADDSLDTPNPWPAESDHGSDSIEDAATPRVNSAATLLNTQAQNTIGEDDEIPSTPTPLPDRSLARGDAAPLIELSDSPTLPNLPDAQQEQPTSSTQPGRIAQANELKVQRPDTNDRSLDDSMPLVDTRAESGSTLKSDVQHANDPSMTRLDGSAADASSTQTQEAQGLGMLSGLEQNDSVRVDHQEASHDIAAKVPKRPPPIPPTDPTQNNEKSLGSEAYVAPPITMQAPLLPQLVEAEQTGEETRTSTTSTQPATQVFRTEDSSPFKTRASMTSATAPPLTQSEHASTEDGSRPASTYSGKNPFLRSMRASIPASVQSSAFSSGQSITQTAAEDMSQTRPVSSAASSSRPESSTFSDYQLFQEAASQLSYNESPPIDVVRPRFNEPVNEQTTPPDANQAVFAPLYESTERLPLVLDARPRRMYDPINNAQVTSNNGSLDLNQIAIPDPAQGNTDKSWASQVQPLSPLPESQPDTSNVTSRSAHRDIKHPTPGQTPRSMPGELTSTVPKSSIRSCDISDLVWSKMIATPRDSRRSHAAEDEDLWTNLPAQEVPEAPRQPDRVQNAPMDIPVPDSKLPTMSSKPANDASLKQTEDRSDLASNRPPTGISTPHSTRSPRLRKSPQVPEHSSAEMYQTSQFVPLPRQESPPPPEGEIEARSAWEQAQLRRQQGMMQVDLDQPLEVVPVEQNDPLDYLRATSIPITSPSISQGTPHLERGIANASSPRMEAGPNRLEASPSRQMESRNPTSTQAEPSKPALSTSQLQKQGAADQQNSVQAVSALMTAGVDTMAGGANGPYPALNRPAQAQHGEHVFAGMQPQRSLVPPFELQNRSLVLPPRSDPQWQGHPPCLECMMRDEDMIDVFVTDPAVWERESDADFYDAIRLEHQERVQNNGRRSPWTMHLTRTRVRKVAIGEPLSAANLKEHTQQLRMNSAQRARVIHAFVADQRVLLGLDPPSQTSNPASSPDAVSSAARNEPLPATPAPVIPPKSTPQSAAPYRRPSDWSVVTSKEEANRMQRTSPTKPPTDAGSSTIPRMQSTGPSAAPTGSSTPRPNLPLSVIPGAPGLPAHASPSFAANTPPRPTTYEVHNDLRPPERPFARSQARLSPSQSMTGFASQVSLAPSASSMAHMHLAFDTPRNRGLTEDAGRAAMSADDSPSAQRTSSRVNIHAAETPSDAVHDAQPDPVAADLGPQAAAFDSDSGHDVSTYNKHKRQSFRGFFRKMVTGKPPPMPTSPSHESRSRSRKPRQAAADANESADNSWVSSSYDDSNRPHFWSKLGKKPHPTRKTSGTRPSVLTDTRVHRTGSHMNDDTSANWTVDTHRDPSARTS